jgi:hypothetical protein
LDGWQQQSRENRNHAHDNEQLDQREAVAVVCNFEHFGFHPMSVLIHMAYPDRFRACCNLTTDRATQDSAATLPKVHGLTTGPPESMEKHPHEISRPRHHADACTNAKKANRPLQSSRTIVERDSTRYNIPQPS